MIWSAPASRSMAAIPSPGTANPMQAVALLEGTVLQTRDVHAGETVGYGATWQARARNPHRRAGCRLQGWRAARLEFAATRTAPPQVFLGGQRCPVIGRVSMDMMAIDVTDLPPTLSRAATGPKSSAPILPSMKRQAGPAPSPMNCSPVWAALCAALFGSNSISGPRPCEFSRQSRPCRACPPRRDRAASPRSSRTPSCRA